MRRKLVLVEVDHILVGAVEEMGVAVLIGAEVFRFVAVMHEQAFEGTRRAVEIVEAVGSGAQVVPARRIGRAAELDLPLHDLRPDRLRACEPLVGGFVELGDVHRLSDVDAAAAEQDDGGLLVRGRRILGEEIGDGLEVGEVALVIWALGELRDLYLAELAGIAPVAERSGLEFILQRIDLFQILRVLRNDADADGEHHCVGRHAMLDDALGQRPLPVRADKGVIAALSAGRAGADVEEIVGIGVRDFDGPVAVGNVGRGEDDRLVLELEQRAAVNGVVVRGVGHDVVGGRQRLHVADLVDRRGQREFLGLLQRRRVQPHLSLALKHRERKREHVVLDADGIIPFLRGLGVGLPNLFGGRRSRRRLSERVAFHGGGEGCDREARGGQVFNHCEPSFPDFRGDLRRIDPARP